MDKYGETLRPLTPAGLVSEVKGQPVFWGAGSLQAYSCCSAVCSRGCVFTTCSPGPRSSLSSHVWVWEPLSELTSRTTDPWLR